MINRELCQIPTRFTVRISKLAKICVISFTQTHTTVTTEHDSDSDRRMTSLLPSLPTQTPKLSLSSRSAGARRRSRPDRELRAATPEHLPRETNVINHTTDSGGVFPDYFPSRHPTSSNSSKPNSSRPRSRSPRLFRSSSPFSGVAVPTPSFEALLPKSNRGEWKGSLLGGGDRDVHSAGGSSIPGKQKQPSPKPFAKNGSPRSGSFVDYSYHDTELTAAASSPPPLTSPSTEEAQDSIGTLCGGLGYCRPLQLSHRTSDGSLSVGCSESDSVGSSLMGLLRLAEREKRKTKVDLEMFAGMHDEIFTVLIDEALRSDGSGGAIDGSEEETEATAPTASIDAIEEQPTSSPLFNARVRSNKHQGPGLDLEANNNSATQPSFDIASIQTKHSPSRISRQISKSMRSSSMKFLKLTRSSASSIDDSVPTAVVGGSTYDSIPSNPTTKSLSIQSQNSNSINSNKFVAVTSNKNPVDHFHPQCVLQKENLKQKLATPSVPPSAVGREATLVKLQKKLSVLGDIESGKFGKASEMLQSDAVAIVRPESDGEESRNQVNQKESNNSNPNPSTKQTFSGGTKVETRSFLTLRIGFISMSYMVIMVWDGITMLVEQVVLRKNVSGYDKKNMHPISRISRRTPLSPMGHSPKKNGGGDSFARRSSDGDKPLPPLAPLSLPQKSKPIVIPSKSMDKDDEECSHDITMKANDQLPSLQGTTSSSHCPENIHGPRLCFPKLPPIWVSSLSNLIGSALTNTATIRAPNNTPQSFLSVSVTNVKKLHGGCTHCRTRLANGKWPVTHRISSKLNNYNPTRKQTMRPYIRFVLGEHEHCTKVRYR